MFAECNNIEPSLFRDECELQASWLGFGLDILSSTCLEEESHIVGVNLASGNENLEAHHQYECDLVLFEESAIDILVNVFGEVLNDKVDTLRW